MNIIKFKLSGLSCAACVNLVSIRFKKMPDVQEVIIDLPSGNAEILSATKIELADLEKSLEGTPYSIVK